MNINIIMVCFFATCYGKTNKQFKVESTLHFKSSNSVVAVFDNLLDPMIGRAINNYLSSGEYVYSYLYPDPYEDMQEIPESGNLHWRAFLSPANFIKSRVWRAVRNAYKSFPDEDFLRDRTFLPYEITGTLLQRGDFTVPFKGDEDTEGKIFVRIFLTENMGKHAYSDQVFYDDNDEIFTSIYPKPYRIIIWTGKMKTLFRPPSMGYEQIENSLLIKLSADKTLFIQGCKHYADRKNKMEEHKVEPFPFKNMVDKFDYEAVNISEKLLAKYHDRYGNVIGVFDNIFPKELVDAIRTYYTMFESSLVYNSYDPASSESHDNVNWLYQFQAESVLNTPYIEMIKRLGAYLSNNTEWYPYDVSCNLIQHTHHTRIHIDCLNEEFEFTFLMYLNPNWTEDMYAETTFYDEELLKTKNREELNYIQSRGLDAYDLITAVIPKFGRIAMFRNLIPHSARPPAPSFLAARYTFPVKVSENFKQGRAKMLREALDYKKEETPEDPRYESLRKGEYEDYLQDDKREFVEKHLKLMREDRRKHKKENLKHIENLLYPKQFKPKRD